LVCEPGVHAPHPLDSIKKIHSGEAGFPYCSIAGTGSVFDTQIRRNTTLRDPNHPKGEPFAPPKECLQWTDWRMNRDVVRRLAIADLHPTRKNLLCVWKAHQLPTELRESAYRELVNKIPQLCSTTAMTNRCVITSRGKGKFFMFRMARTAWRLLADYNKLSGVQKSTWGP
jgi:small subunit ribosomal protein S14